MCENCRPVVEKMLKELKEALEERFEKRIAALEERNRQLEAQLAQFMNPHTPPSLARNYKNRKVDDNKSRGIPGQKPGHEGTTRKQPEPNRRITVLAPKCASCHSKLPEPKFFEKRVIEEIPEPQPLLVTEFMIAHYECPGCGAETIAKHPECPEAGMFGTNVLALASLMKHKWRIPYRMACDAMQIMYGLTLSAATVLDLNRRVSDALEPEYERIKENIRNADIVYSDETSAPMNGDNRWNWAFSTPTDVLFAIRDSRSGDVLDEILGNDFDGAMVNDGWKPYGEYAHEHGLQMGRCWAHILREADDLAEKMPAAKGVADNLHKILHDLTEEVKRTPMKERRRLYANGLRRLRRLTRKRFRKPKAKKFMEKVERARINLMTFVLVPGMEPTNNRSERNLREPVIQRKISRTFRSEKGIRINEIQMSVFATWQARGWNCYTELLKRLT